MPSKAELIVKSNFHQRKMIRYYYVLDADRDGHIEKEDYVSCGLRLAEQRNQTQGSAGYSATIKLFEDAWDELCRYADTSGDSEIEMDEWLSYREDIYHGYGANREVLEDPAAERERIGEHMLAMMDSDGDGFVNVDDFTKFYIACRLPEDLAANMFKLLDVSKRGHLTREDVILRFDEFVRSDEPDAAGNWFFGPF